MMRTATLGGEAGTCWGVDRAIDGAMGAKEIRGKPDQFFYVLGNMVHNPLFDKELAEKGIRIVEDINEARGSTLFITAHGRDPKDIARAKEILGEHHVIDMTCPIVKYLHEMALELKHKGKKMVLIGIRSRPHAEVAGAVGVLEGDVCVVESLNDVERIPYGAQEPIGVVNQTTFNAGEIDRILEAIRARYADVKYIPTMCDDIMRKQTELRERGPKFDLIIVVGAKKSANSTHLAEIARDELHKRTLFVLDEQELREEDLAGAEHIFVTAGASAPESSIEGIVEDGVVKKEGVMRKLERLGFARDDALDIAKP